VVSSRQRGERQRMMQSIRSGNDNQVDVVVRDQGRRCRHDDIGSEAGVYLGGIAARHCRQAQSLRRQKVLPA
jgi:hypothetical protein